VGIVAAAGIFALERNVLRLEQDHANAQALARGLRDLGFKVDPWPQTNIVHFRTAEISPNVFVKEMLTFGVRMTSRPDGYVRAVTHLDISPPDLEFVINATRQVRDRLSRERSQ
jgi:threonine aldolase